MYPFVETIRWMQGQALRLPYHEQRLNATRQHFWPGCSWIDLGAFLDEAPGKCEGKCRVVYDGEGIREIAFAPYTLRQVRSLRLLEVGGLDYTYKSTDRRALNHCWEQRGTADDVLLVRHGWITDTSIANIALFDGYTWYTPANPLLKGTHRAALLDAHLLCEKEIRADELSAYSRVRLFNAMIDWGSLEIPVEALQKF